MTDFIDYYIVLEVEFSATPKEIKKAYRRLAIRYHPDKQSGSDTKMKLLNVAHETLGNVEKKKAYDELWRQHYGGASTKKNTRNHTSPGQEAKQKTRPQTRRDGKFAADFDGNPPRDRQTPLPHESTPFSAHEFFHAILQWFSWHPILTAIVILWFVFLVLPNIFRW